VNKPDSVAGLLAQVTIFGVATPAEIEQLAAQAYPRRLSKGQVLFVEGEPADAMYVVRSGRVKVLVGSPRGDELVLAVLGPGDSFGELSLVDASPRSAGAEAVDDVELVCLPAAAVQRLLAASAAVSLAMAQELAELLRARTGASADLVFLDLPRRLAKLLVSGDETVDGMSQAQVAARLGVGRQTLNRALSRFADRGWVDVQRAGIDVLDEAALLRFSQS
jgi:CRP-like cAMP-binding protein